ncbi:MAG: DNA polymerase I [Selenomonadaceae bacterium]|nr:DNA polymerase I [Selenomonadaceae bacterium]
MKKFLIIDGSSLFYRAFYAMPALTSPNGEPTGAVTGFANILLKILRENSPDLAAVALDKSKKTFRNEIFSDYKATRQEMPDDLAAQLPLLKEFIEVIGIKTCAAAGYEADDIIGTLATQASAEDCFIEILTGDHDAFQLIDFSTKVLLNKNARIESYDGQRFFEEYGFKPPLLIDYKGLRGDPSDNIPGVRGIGVKIATSLIQEYGTLENVLEHREEIKTKKVRDALEKFADTAILSKKLAQIVCNVPEIVFKAKDFEIKPDLERADDFCRRYALNFAKKKIHELFDAENVCAPEPESNLFAPAPENIPPVTPPPPKAPSIDFEKILAAEKLTIAEFNMKHFAIKIFDGEVFTVKSDDVQKILDEFGGQIILNGLKNYLHVFKIANLERFFDLELAAYLLYPEQDKTFRNSELGMDKNFTETVKIFEKLAPQYEKNLADSNLTKLYREIELPLTEVLAKMEMRGVLVDKVRLKGKAAEFSERINAIVNDIYELAGETFNINSPKQLAEILFVSLKLPPVKKTKNGFSTNAEVLEEIKWRHPIVSKILDYRALTKLKSTYLDGIFKLIDKQGRVHTNFNQTVTATGRLSSSDPNLQNIPVRTEEGREIRAMFVPGEGYDCILSADYSQIELRLLAHMSGDENLIDAFIKGQDIHARTASEVFGVPIEEVAPDLRRKAKAVNFGIVYGISDYGLSQDLHISRQEAGEYIVRYFERYPGVKDFLDVTVAQAELHGYVMTMFGRRRALYGINSNNFNVRSLAQRMAMNTPIQGSAADIIKLAMIKAEENLRGFESRIIIQVHDELVLEAKNSEFAEVEKILRDSMENVMKLSVPLVVDIHSGANWSLAK